MFGRTPLNALHVAHDMGKYNSSYGKLVVLIVPAASPLAERRPA